MAILTAVPASIIAGDSVRFTLDFSADYPPATWAMTFYAENASGNFSSLGVASGTQQAFSLAPATTAAYIAGRYNWFLRAVSGAISEIAGQGWLEVLPDPSAAGNIDRRSWARQALDAIEATLLGRATDDQLAMTVGGRSLSRHTLKELTDWRGQLRAEVATAEALTANGLGRQIRVRASR
jgi:hypothetical protein